MNRMAGPPQIGAPAIRISVVPIFPSAVSETP